MADQDERYEDCTVCHERFVGEFIRKYIRYVEIHIGRGIEEVCLSCLLCTGR